MNIAKQTKKLLACGLVSILSLTTVPEKISAWDSNVETFPKVESGNRVDPPFRTNLAMHVAFGGNSCVGGGTGYASCSGTESAWDFGWGLSAGMLVRPVNRISFGIDFAVTNMRSHQETANKWRDITIGPVIRYHQPLKIRKLYFEPNIGIQAGYVGGNYTIAKRLGTSKEVNYENQHKGAFLAAVLGLDFFPLPRVAVGIEVRVIRTLYTEVCFEYSDGISCRGIKDKAIVERYDLDSGLPSELGIVDYPWKLFYGIHGLYYF